MRNENTDSETGNPRSGERRSFLASVGIAGLGAIGATGQVAASQHDESDDDESGDDDASDDSTDTPTAIDSCTVIDEPGEYELVADVVAGEDDPFSCIRIEASNVTLRGNGCAVVREGDASDGNGIHVSGTGHLQDPGEVDQPDWDEIQDVVVEDLAVEGFRTGLLTAFVSGVRLTGVTARDNRDGLVVAPGSNETEVTDTAFIGNDFGVVPTTDVHGGVAPTSPGRIDFEHNDLVRNGVGIVLGDAVQGYVFRMNRIVENVVGVHQQGWFVGGNRLVDNVICRNEEFGVRNAPSTDFVEGEESPVIATDNYWGAVDGPSSYGDPDEPFADPETGRPADGGGDAIAESLEPGVSNVQFDPFHEETIEAAGVR